MKRIDAGRDRLPLRDKEISQSSPNGSYPVELKYIFSALAILAWIVGAFLQGYWALVANIGGNCAFNIVIISICKGITRRSLPSACFYLMQTYQPFALLLILFTAWPESADMIFPFYILLDHPFRISAGLTAIPVGILLGYALAHAIRVRRNHYLTIHHLLRFRSASWSLLLCATAVGNLGIWIGATDSVGLLNYLFRLLWPVTTFGALFTAIRWRQEPLAVCLWVGSILIGLIISIYTGSRFYVYIPLGLVVIGLSVTEWMTRRISLWKLVLFGAIASVGLLLFSLTNSTRAELGRRSANDINQISVNDIFEAMTDAASNRSDSGTHGFIMTHNLPRLIQWCNLVVPAMTPSIVPYRGLSGLTSEFKNALGMGLFGGNQYWAANLANNYGFLTTESTSVEFGVIADGWSRAGWMYATFTAMLAGILFSLMENWIVTMSYRFPNVTFGVLCVVCYQASFGCYTNTFIATIRSTTLHSIFAVILFVCVAKFGEIFMGKMTYEKRR